METLTKIVTEIDGLVWGPPMLLLILGTGFFLQLKFKFMPLYRIGTGFAMIWRSRKSEEGAKGDITPFAALMTAMAATVGTGNIVGVATALSVGGPGALFWMWMTALVGMATKYAEVVLAVHYRETDEHGQQLGGPMFAIKNGLKRKWHWLAALFAIFGGISTFGIGNMIQAKSIADAMQATFSVSPWVTGIILMIITGVVLLGGVRRIGAVAEKLVPFMCVAYVVTALVILCIYVDRLPAAFALIFEHAFSPAAATGGFTGATIMLAIRHGVARGVFSNEAGLGTAGIAQAAGQSKSPVQSGLIGMMGTFLDTIVACSMTGLVLLVTGVWNSGVNGAALSASAFELALPGFGQYMLSMSLVLFAFTTILGWAYYGEKCWGYFFGAKVEKIFRILTTLCVPIGALMQLDFAWLITDVLNGLMAIPNLISLILLSPVVVALTNAYFKKHAG